MDRLITPPISQRHVSGPSPDLQKKPSGSFTKVLTEIIDKTIPQTKPVKARVPAMLVGEITRETPTVSELLKQHKELSSSTWDIIHAETNQNKDYTKILPGTFVYYNPEDGSLTWSRSESTPFPLTESNQFAQSQTVLSEKIQQPEVSSKEQLIRLGIIDVNTPTVSHILNNHPEFREQMWELLGSSINQDKPYHRITAGTDIHLNPGTMEIVWGDVGTTPPVSDQAAVAIAQPSNISTPPLVQAGHSSLDLSEAVKGYKGISYDEINCYELLVKGLDNLDIAYSGKNGLFSKLTNMAAEKGLPANAYLNGEGIVKAAGSTILSRDFEGITNWKDKAGSLIKEIEPLLESGQILSFSTQKRGHTGIVARKDNQWTFINSGRMDNSIDQDSVSRGVGEELLNEEISNWFKTAQKKSETLSVTLGQLDQGKIQTALSIAQSYSKRI